MTEVEVARIVSTIKKAPPRATHHCAYRMRILKRAGYSSGEIGARTGHTRKHVSNLLRLLRELHPKIQADWERLHPAAALDPLLRLAAINPSWRQLRPWEGRKAARERRAG